MIAPEDYHHHDPVAWTLIREPLTRWLDGVLTDLPLWHQLWPVIRDINRPDATDWDIQQIIHQLTRDHCALQSQVLTQDYQWEECELWPIEQYDRARQENGARWNSWTRTDPGYHPWHMTATRWDLVEDLVNRIDDWPRLWSLWRQVFDRDVRLWHAVNQHWQTHHEPMVVTRRQFQSRRTWPSVDHSQAPLIQDLRQQDRPRDN